MLLCRILGTVVATQKNPHLGPTRLLVVQPLDLRLQPKGAALLALDAAEAGESDLVLVNKEGGGARMVFQSTQNPVQAVVVGVVDSIDVDPTLAKLPAAKA